MKELIERFYNSIRKGNPLPIRVSRNHFDSPNHGRKSFRSNLSNDRAPGVTATSDASCSLPFADHRV